MPPYVQPLPGLMALLATPAHEEWVCTARSFVSSLLTHWRICVEDRDSAVLIVSELAANAAEHGRSDMTVGLLLRSPHSLHITVTDRGGSTTIKGKTEVDPDECGRGLHIVDCLATNIEFRQADDGRQVCAELDVGVPTGFPEQQAPWSRPKRQLA